MLTRIVGDVEEVLSEEEETALRKEWAEFKSFSDGVTSYENTKKFKDSVQELLDSSDLVLTRCLENGISFPSEWREYRAALRILKNTGTPDSKIPDRPQYPAAT